MKLKYLSALLFSLTIAACGGGSDSEVSNGGSGSGGTGNGGTGSGQSFSAVSGQFTDATNESQKFPNYARLANSNLPYTEEIDGGQKSMLFCSQSYNYYYFESKYAKVYGNPSYADDLKKIASVIDESYELVLKEMGFTVEKFGESKLKFHKNYLFEAMIQGINNGQFDSVKMAGFGVNVDANIWDPYSVKNYRNDVKQSEYFDYAVKIMGSLSKEKHMEIDAINETSPLTVDSFLEVQDKVTVCANETLAGLSSGQGRGMQTGIVVVPFEKYDSAGAEKVSSYKALVKHELVHYFQMALGAVGVDRWFLEGQAVYISGQQIASKADYMKISVPPVFAKNTNSETEMLRTFSETNKYELIYKHYGLAYSMLVKYNKDVMDDVLVNSAGAAVRHYYEPHSGIEACDTDGNYQDVRSCGKFEEAFANSMVDKNGAKMSLYNLKSNYNFHMGNYASSN